MQKNISEPRRNMIENGDSEKESDDSNHSERKGED